MDRQGYKKVAMAWKDSLIISSSYRIYEVAAIINRVP